MTNKPMLSERDKFEVFWRSTMNVQDMDLHRCEFPMTDYEDQPYACHETERGRLTWMARALLDKPATIGSGDEDLVPFMRPALRDPVVGNCTHPPGCKSCSWCGFKEDPTPAIKLHLNVSNVKVTVNSDGSYTIDPADQPRLQGEPEELSTEELRFLDAVALNPGSKLNGGIACGEEGNSLWPRLEALGLIECLGSYKWQLTFSAFEMGVKAFLGMRPAQVAADNSALLGILLSEITVDDRGFYHLSGIHPGNFKRALEASGAKLTSEVKSHKSPVAVVMPERMDPRDPYDSEANQWNACLDEVARLNGVKP